MPLSYPRSQEDEYELHCRGQHLMGKSADMMVAGRTALLVALREMSPRILTVAAYLFSARQVADLLEVGPSYAAPHLPGPTEQCRILFGEGEGGGGACSHGCPPWHPIC